ncbi:VapE domain-containing protein [Acidovorax sp. Q11]
MNRAAISEWLHTLDGTWDGHPRLQEWLSRALGVQPTTYLAMAGQALVRAHVARALRPGVHFPFAPVLYGPQGTGKSLLIRTLVGAENHNDSHIDPFSKPGPEGYQNLWAYEAAELEALNHALRAQLVEFITRQDDTYRTATGGVVLAPRGFIAWLTCNGSPPLLRRIALEHRLWPIEVPHQVETAWLLENRVQIFAEALNQFTWGPRPDYFITNEEADAIKAGRADLLHKLQSSEEDELLIKVQPGEFVTIAGLAAHLRDSFHLGSAAAETRLRLAFDRHGFTPAREAGGNRRRGYLAPQRPTAQTTAEAPEAHHATQWMPEAGAVTLFALTRPPYAARPSLEPTRLDQTSDGALVDLLSAASSANTATTSELVGAVRMLAAMARAVRNRSYVLMAADTSAAGAPAFCMASSRVSKASVKSFTAMGFSVWEVDLSGDGSEGGAA